MSGHVHSDMNKSEAGPWDHCDTSARETLFLPRHQEKFHLMEKCVNVRRGNGQGNKDKEEEWTPTLFVKVVV